MNGVLVVDKPAGMTSHDVVDTVRRLAHTRRVGHTGTLDPMATGVLVLLLGPATRLSRFAMEGKKRYRGVVRLGTTTTTYDAEGEVAETQPVDVSLEQIETALAQFRGDILQVPPMYAAVRVAGRRLYKLAREGKVVEREPRAVTIYELTILDWHLPDLTLDVVCSSGTYIRSLAHDLGQALGCGAHLAQLRRTRSGPFTLAQSRSLDELERFGQDSRFEKLLLPPHTALGEMPAVVLTPEQERAIRYGQTIALPGMSGTSLESADFVQARDPQGRLVAVLVPREPGHYRPTLVLPPESQTGGQ